MNDQAYDMIHAIQDTKECSYEMAVNVIVNDPALYKEFVKNSVSQTETALGINTTRPMNFLGYYAVISHNVWSNTALGDSTTIFIPLKNNTASVFLQFRNGRLRSVCTSDESREEKYMHFGVLSFERIQALIEELK